MNTLRLFVPLALSALQACGGDPEVLVVNEVGEAVLVRGISFHGCKWDTMLAYGQTTSSQFCLPGNDRVHFQKLDAAAYCEKQVDYGNLPDLCFCDETREPRTDPFEESIVSPRPTWFNYQTISIKSVGEGSFYRFVLTAEDLEQDFSVPGPYGH